MRLSCNGCRVLRRGCNPDCPIKACLQWMNSPESESNATLFLAKFYGRAGLINLLSAAPPQLQPAVFKSLLYEACGRIVNPVFGSTGLLSTGRWQLCEAAVKAVLSGAPIEQQALDGAVSQLQACDIRHVAKSGGKSCGPDRLQRDRSRMKRRAGKLKPECSRKKVVERGSVSGDSAGSGVSEHRSVGVVVEADSTSSPVDEELELELTLGWGPLKRSGSGTVESRD